jgi:hypothetical protein
MKTKIQNSINQLGLVFLIMMSLFIWGCGCNTSKPVPDPLAGWQKDYTPDPSDQIIEKDYKDYIQTLSPEEKKYIGPYSATFFKDGTGQRAVLIRIGINGTDWWHILTYNKDNKRIKTIKYAAGDYHI